MVGVGDQETATLYDPLFRWTGVRTVRMIVPWDVALADPSGIQGWLDAARETDIEPLIAFQRRRNEVSHAYLPTPAQYSAAFAAFRARWPWIHAFTPWNEANHPPQPTAHKPAAAATFYEIIRDACAGCQVVAADVLEGEDMEGWLRGFLSALDRPARLWSLHNFNDTARGVDTMTRRMLGIVPGELWLGETGGLVYFLRQDGTIGWHYDEQRAARAVDYVFRLAGAYPRITRVYIYNWRAKAGAPWDSGLLGPHGEIRPSFETFAAHVRPGVRPPAILGTARAGPGGVRPGGASGARRGTGPLARAFGRPRLRGRAVSLAVACPAAAGRFCTVRLKVATMPRRGRTSRRRGDRVRPVVAWVRMPPGGRFRLRVRVAPRLLRLVRRGRARLRARVDLGDGWGRWTVVRRRARR